jgi:hypothetical protein
MMDDNDEVRMGMVKMMVKMMAKMRMTSNRTLFQNEFPS